MHQILHHTADLVSKLYDLARPYGRKKLIFVFAVTVVQGLFQVVGVTSVFPFLALASDPGQVRDSAIGASILAELPEMTDRTLLIAAGCFALIMLFVSNGLLLLGEITRIRYAQGLGHWLRLRLISHITANPYGYFLERNTGELLKKTATDVDQMVQGVLLPLLDGASRVLSILLLFGSLLFVDPPLAIAATVGLGGFYGILFAALNRRRAQHSEQLKTANRGAMREAQQLLGGIKPVKIHQSEDFFIERFAAHSHMIAILRKWQPLYQNTPRYLVEPLSFGGMVAVVILLAAQGQNLSSLLPKLGVMALAGYRLLPNLQLLYGSATQMSMMAHTADEVHDEFLESNQCRAVNKGPQSPKCLEWRNHIRIENLTFRYPGTSKPLFENLNFEIRKNQFIAIIGKTGSGKSTLVDLLLGLHSADEGCIAIDGLALCPSTVSAWRAGIGYVPQDIFLLDDTIAANIAFGVDPKRVDLERVAEVARIAQIAEVIEGDLQDGYQSRVGERGVRLSGGQRQRIGLARALYHGPTTLILDEATSALDDTTETALMQAIESLQGQVTLIVIAHRISTIEKADRILELDHGRIVNGGS